MSGARLKGFLLLSVLLLPIFSVQAIRLTDKEYDILITKAALYEDSYEHIEGVSKGLQKRSDELLQWQIKLMQKEQELAEKEVKLLEKISELRKRENELNEREKLLQQKEKEESQDDGK